MDQLKDDNNEKSIYQNLIGIIKKSILDKSLLESSNKASTFFKRNRENISLD